MSASSQDVETDNQFILTTETDKTSNMCNKITVFKISSVSQQNESTVIPEIWEEMKSVLLLPNLLLREFLSCRTGEETRWSLEVSLNWGGRLAVWGSKGDCFRRVPDRRDVHSEDSLRFAVSSLRAFRWALMNVSMKGNDWGRGKNSHTRRNNFQSSNRAKNRFYSHKPEQ